MTKRFQDLIHVVELYKGKIEINHIFRINFKNCNLKQIAIIIDYLFNYKFKILNKEIIELYQDKYYKKIDFLDIDLEKNHIDNPKWKSNNSYIPISTKVIENTLKMISKVKKSWNSCNDYLYFENG